MGQKVHPYGFRLGVIYDWRAKWFAKGTKYKDYLQEDLKIRDFLKKRLKEAQYSNCYIERTPDKVSVTVFVARPGMVIGQRGREVEQLKKELQKIVGKKDISIDVQEIRVPELDAQLVAQNIAQKIEQRVSQRKAMKRAVESAMRMGAKGIKVQCKGRLGGAEIARKEWYIVGRVPLGTIRADIDYGYETAYTKMGTIGVKVWIYKGDILGKEVEEE